MDKETVIYHGGPVKIPNPNILLGRINIDFGQGFYTTTDYEMAAKWASMRATSIVNQYVLNPCGLNIVHLVADKGWLDYVSGNRGFSDKTIDDSGVDVVIGPTADDKLFGTLERYWNKEYSTEETLKILQLGNLHEQIVLKTSKAIRQLTFEKSYSLSENEIKHYRKLTEISRNEANRRYKEINDKIDFVGHKMTPLKSLETQNIFFDKEVDYDRDETIESR